VRRFAYALGIVAASIFASAGTSSADPAPSPSPTGLTEIGRVSTSDRQDEPRSASARTTFIVTKAEMVAHGDRTVADSLERVPGVNITRYGAFGSQAGIAIRGASTNQVLVLLDGRPVGGSQLGGVDLSSFVATGIERIEVVEGPGATLYGAGAVGGVVNLITGKGRSAYLHPQVDLGIGSYGDRFVSIETKNFALERHVATNNYAYPVSGAATSVRTNDDAAETTARATTSGTLGAFALTAGLGVTSRHLGIPGPDGFGTVAARQEDGATDARVVLSQRRNAATTTIDISGVRERVSAHDFDTRDSTNGFVPSNQTSIESRAQLSVRNVVSSDASRLIYGIDLTNGSARNDDGVGDVAAKPFAQTAAYVQESLQVAAGSRIYAGIRAERDGGLGGAISPSVGAVIALADGVAARINGATSFRAPFAAELYYPNFGNPKLRAERTSGGDITISSTHVLGGASLGYFISNGRDLISYDSTANTDINIAQSAVSGLTFEVQTVPLNGFITKLNLTDTYRALGFTPGLSATRLPYRPTILANLDLGFVGDPTARLAGLGVVAHTEGLRDPTGAFTFTRIDAYARLRIVQRTLLSLRATNLGNERYAVIAGYPQPGRAFFVDLSTR
jgi:vitamin B12 transporter